MISDNGFPRRCRIDLMTPAELVIRRATREKTLNREVGELKNSASLKDQICGLLMDMHIGSSGMHRPAVEAKSVAILELVNESA